VEHLVRNQSRITAVKEYVFIGFNALNRCEEELFEFLLNHEKAKFYWDFDDYYVSDETQEAGSFLRKNMSRFPNSNYSAEYKSLTSSPKKLKIVNIASQAGQVQVAANELINLNSGELNFDETAVVLCDEELLLPMINALPESNNKVNVTMGYPLKMTPVFSLVSQLIALQKNCRFNGGEMTFYNKDVMRVLNHQLVIDFEPSASKELLTRILKNNVIYLSETELTGNLFFSQLFWAPQDIPGLSDYFVEIIRVIFTHWQQKSGNPNEAAKNIQTELIFEEHSTIYCEYLYRAFLAVNKLKDIVVNDSTKVFNTDNFVSKESFFRFLIQYLSGLSIPFDGEPLEGLQIMGILETRTLDFKNLIILSMNDGTMPRISSTGSFIPYNLRRVFGLPTIEEQNAMYAYYFYRLIQRAENVTFVYDSGANGLFTGEKSRYLYQLLLESPFEISETNFIFNIEQVPVHPIQVEKSPKVMTKLNDYLTGARPLSPSAIDKYLTCPLQFYFRYSAGLDEPDEISEEVDAKIFGLLFHDAMEKIYQPFIGKTVKYEDVETILQDQEYVHEIINASFLKVYFKGIKSSEQVSLKGRNWLVFEIVKKYVNQLLVVDRKRVPFEIAGLEKKVNSTMDINDSDRKVLIGGTIDRIDRINNSLYIYDYKTGSTSLDFPVMESLFDRENKTRNKAAFQTLVYSYILYKNEPQLAGIYPGIYALRGIFEEDYDPSLRSREIGNKAVEFVSVSGQFELHFRLLLEEIFNTDIPFQQTEITENCKYCSYKQICRK